MSTGLGRRQRQILDRLAELDGDGAPQRHPLADMYDGTTRDRTAEFESLRRAAHKLATAKDGRYVTLTHRLVGTQSQVYLRLTRRGREVVSKADDGTT